MIHILQGAYSGELAAARAYGGHWRTLRAAAERAEVQRIEQAELVHRAEVGRLLALLGARPQRWREVLMGAVGSVFGALCWVSGWFFPMYMAGRLEASNVAQYEAAVDCAAALGLGAGVVALLEEMVAEERRHERWFSDRVTGHWLLAPAAAVFRWRPAAP